MNLLYYCNIIIPVENTVCCSLCMLTALLYFSTEYHNFKQNLIIMFRKYLYLVDVWSDVWLNLFWGKFKWKIVFNLCLLPSVPFPTTYLPPIFISHSACIFSFMCLCVSLWLSVSLPHRVSLCAETVCLLGWWALICLNEIQIMTQAVPAQAVRRPYSSRDAKYPGQWSEPGVNRHRYSSHSMSVKTRK
jgi:hypothetical protein